MTENYDDVNVEVLVEAIETGLYDEVLSKIKDAVADRLKATKEMQKTIEKEQKKQADDERALENKANVKVGDVICITYTGQEDVPKEVLARVTGTQAKSCSFVILNEDGTPYIRKIGKMIGKPLSVWKKWSGFTI